MTQFEVLTNAAAATEIRAHNVDRLLDAGRIEVAMNNGNWWRIRRNGATRKWKKDPSRLYVPYKAGLKVYGAITETDFIDGLLNPHLFRFIVI